MSTANQSEVILEVLNNISQEYMLIGYLQSLTNMSNPQLGVTQMNSSYENLKILNSELLSTGKSAKATYYSLKEKELVVVITLIGVLLFSTVLMFMATHFPHYAWLVTMLISGCAITGILVAVYAISNYSIMSGSSFTDQSNSSPLDASINITMPFLIFTTIMVLIAAIAAFIVWFSARKASS